MESTKNYYIPYFPQPPPKVAPPPRRSPPAVPPPPPPHNIPSPPKVPPPFHPNISPPPPPQFPVPTTPPPHPFFPPPPPPPSPPSGHHSSTIIVVVFVSLGGLFFLAFLSVALFCFLKKKKKVQKSELVHVDEHVKVEEAIISGPHGEEMKVLSVEEDVHIQEEVDKKSVVEDLNSKASTSGSNHQHHKA